MVEITATLVKDLREATGAGMMDCKHALTESGGDMESAVDWLRKKGLSAAAKKSGRVTSEGLVGVIVEGTAGAIVEVNAETDFVARNETFQEFVITVTRLALDTGNDTTTLENAPYPGTDKNVGEHLGELIATVGENINLRRAAALSVDKGIIGSYVHNALSPGLGRIGVLVSLDSSAPAADLKTLGKQLAMHIAAASPQAVSPEDVDSSDLDRERSVLAEQARASEKPEEIIEKMVEGRLRKFYEEVCLLEQTFVIDGETKVRKVLEDVAEDLGVPVAVRGFARIALGEGIGKKDENFAAEVAAAAGGGATAG